MAEEPEPRVERILAEVAGLEPPARKAAIERLCAGDARLGQAVAAALAGGAAANDAAPTRLKPTASGLWRGARGDGQAGPRDTPRPLPRIDGYEVRRVLAEGGMGVVFLAEQVSPVRRQVALKVIRAGIESGDLIARFAQERQALARMSHPNIAAVYHAGVTDNGSPYFAMEYVPGEPITTFCDRRNLTLGARIELAVLICDAVHHAHQKFVIHRDLKPSNVLVAEHGTQRVPKVIDFGLAKAIGPPLIDDPLKTVGAPIMGTPGYMSPEQARGDQEALDTRTDIYSLGVLVYELLAGAPPFDPDLTRDQMLRHICEVTPPRPSVRFTGLGHRGPVARERGTDERHLARSLRGELDWIVMKAIEKEPSRRYQSAAELGADLGRYLRQEPVQARAPSAGYRLRTYVRRHRRRIVAVATSAVVVIGATVATAMAIERRTFNQSAARTRALLREGTDALAAAQRAEADAATLRAEWEAADREAETWQPVWEREAVIRARAALDGAIALAARERDAAAKAFSNAREAAPSAELEREAARMLEAMYFEDYAREASGSVASRPLDLLRQSIEALGLGTYARELEGGGRAELRSEPAGARVYAFQYVPSEERLVPRPYGGGTAHTGPPLRVEAVWREDVGPFQAGDRLLSVGGTPVATESDLAKQLRDVAEDEVARVVLERGGERLEREWVPFPGAFYAARRAERPGTPLAAGRLLNSRDQLGITFAAYELELTGSNLLGTAPLEIELAAASYLFVFQMDGRAEARLPLSVPLAREPEPVVLLPEDDVPPGFVYIPGGWFGCGGDRPGAFQSLQRAVAHVEGFCMSRLEVTIGEYLEFLNSPEVAARLMKFGDSSVWDAEMESLDESVQVAAARSNGVIQVTRTRLRNRVPYMGFRYDAASGTWRTLDDRVEWIAQPMLDASQLAAREFAAWRTRHDQRGFRYRLPTDLEWEKAARGSDRRTYVWGNSMVWSFCSSLSGTPPPGRVVPVGSSPMDESVYGVRDMAGSASEWTTGRTLESYTAYRGGNWNTPDEYFFRTATRNGMSPTGSAPGLGFRLVAELRTSN